MSFFFDPINSLTKPTKSLLGNMRCDTLIKVEYSSPKGLETSPYRLSKNLSFYRKVNDIF
jgi:hypothetical protein